jgi:glucose-6-phosphate 1-epimerase
LRVVVVVAGFARNLEWEVMATSPSPVPSVSLRLADTDATRAMWPHSFEAIYTVTLANDRYAAPRRCAWAGLPDLSVRSA